MSINFLDFQKEVKAKAKTYKIPGLDWEDIAQELNIHLWLKRDKYNPGRKASPKTFVQRILTNKLRDLARITKAKKRYIDYNHLSLEELMENKNFQI